MRAWTLWLGSLCAAGTLACTEGKDPEPTPTPVDTAPEFTDITIRFEARVDGAPFNCATEYNYLGSTGGAAVRFNDFRMFLTSVSLTNGADEATPLTLDNTDFQDSNLALLDFEDGLFNCDGGTEVVNTTVTGQVPSGDYSGLAFTVGVPFELNHGDIEQPPSPLLADPTLQRSLLQGYYFFKLDTVTSGEPEGYPLYVTSSGCRANSLGAVETCLSPNRVTFSFDNFDPATQTVVLDLGTLMSRNDMEANKLTPPPQNQETPAGCQSDPTDPDCRDFFVSYGMSALPQEWITVE